MKIKPRLMWRRGADRSPTTSVVEDVARRTAEAAQLAKIAGQNRLTDPRTNPAVRAHADRLLNKEHERTLDAAYARKMRRHRVEERRAGHAERALGAIQEAQEARSPAESVLFLHRRRKLYMRMSMVLSVGLAGGSAMGLENLAEQLHVPAGSGYIVEGGLTWLATVAIQARADLAQHSVPTDHKDEKRDWRTATLWMLMVVPLTVSMAANVHGHNIIGALCAAGAAAFGLFSYVVSDLFAGAAKAQAARVAREDEKELRDVASGDDLSSQPERPPQTFFEERGLPFVPAMFPPRQIVVQAEQVHELAIGSDASCGDQVQTQTPTRSETHGSDPNGSDETRRSETSQTHRSQTQVSDQVPDPTADRSQTHTPDQSDPKVSDQVPSSRSQTRKTQTGPKKQTRSKTQPKVKPLDRLNEAIAADKAYLADHGRHIPAEKLARAMSIGKPAALDLVKQVRGGHLDLAKAVDE